MPILKMSNRAKTYMLILALRCLLFAMVPFIGPFIFPQLLAEHAFLVLVDDYLAAAIGVVGVAAIAAVVFGSAPVARYTLLASSVVSAAWLVSLLAVVFSGGAILVGYPIVVAALIFKDLVMSANPLVSPFEDLHYALAADDLDSLEKAVRDDA